MTPSEILDLYRGTAFTTAQAASPRVIAARQFIDWCEQNGVQFPKAEPVDVLRFLQSQRAKGNAESTVVNKLQSLQHLYRWLIKQAMTESSPAEGLPTKPQQPKHRETLTVAELRSVWEAAPTESHKAVVGLLGFSGMRPDEVAALDVPDMRVEDGYETVRVRSRPLTRGHVQVLLPPEVSRAIRYSLGGRRAGPLVTRLDGQRHDRNSLGRMVAISAKYAGIPFKVNSLTLTYTLRALAIEHGFSYIGVVRAVGEMHPTKAARWIDSASYAPGQHAAIRLGRLAFGEPNTVRGMLDEADICLSESTLPEAIAVMTAGAALEKHLRELCRENHLPFDKPENRLQMKNYRDRLTGKGTITYDASQRIDLIEKRRNQAAHGWFELITRDIAQDVISECRKIIEQFPLSN